MTRVTLDGLIIVGALLYHVLDGLGVFDPPPRRAPPFPDAPAPKACPPPRAACPPPPAGRRSVRTARAHPVVARAAAGPSRCAWCHDALGPAPTRCPACATALHAACALEARRCPVAGCRRGGARRRAA